MPPALALVFWTVLGLLGGASLVVQASLIAGLRARLDSVVWAGLVSYLGGTAAMAAAILVARISPPSLPRTSAIPLQWWIGGFFGAAYLAVAILLLPRLGAATVVALVVAGQLLCSLLFDRFAILGVPYHPLTPGRLVGAILLVAGVALIRS
jgi:bacterial/archaeal transporter family-2 protein